MGTGGQHRVTLSMVEIYNEAVRSGAPGASCLAPSPNLFCLRPPEPSTESYPLSPGTSLPQGLPSAWQ